MTFEIFWGEYPRKINKTQAKKAYDKAIKKGITNEILIRSVNAYARYVDGIESKYICHAATWLNQCRWENDYGALTADNLSQSETGLSISSAIKISQENQDTLGMEQGKDEHDRNLPF